MSPYFELNQTINTIRKSANSLILKKDKIPDENVKSLKMQIIQLFLDNLDLLKDSLSNEIKEMVAMLKVNEPESLT